MVNQNMDSFNGYGSKSQVLKAENEVKLDYFKKIPVWKYYFSQIHMFTNDLPLVGGTTEFILTQRSCVPGTNVPVPIFTVCCAHATTTKKGLGLQEWTWVMEEIATSSIPEWSRRDVGVKQGLDTRWDRVMKSIVGKD